jgi:hypothetical protein
MTHLIVVTNTIEQKDVMSFLKESLISQYYTDTDVTVVQSGITKIDVYHSVGGVRNIANTYKVAIVPVSMSLDPLYGYSPTTNININRLLARLDKMKDEAIAFVNTQKKPSKMVNKQKEALARAAKLLFD